MTDTTTPSTPPVSQVEHLDPATLLVDRNVRHDLRLDKAFCASVRDNGVLVPITGVRTETGEVRVRYGHRRVAAALAEHRPTVPVNVVADERTDKQAEIERLVAQHAENHHRAGLTTAENVGVMEQLSAFGLTAAKIATRTKAPRKEVDAALAVAGSTLARAASARYDFLDLTQAATVAEFEDDPDTVKALVVAARDGRFDHVAQQARDERARTQRWEAFAANLREDGTTLVEADEGTRLGNLVDEHGAVLTAATHANCPGHAAYLYRDHGYVDPATGFPPVAPASDLTAAAVRLDDPAQDSDGDQSDDADQGDDADQDYLDEDDEDEDSTGTTWGEYPTAMWVCTDPAGNGHQPRYRGYDSGSDRPKRSEMTPEQAEAARADRRDVIASNKAWTSSVEVRRTWLRALLARKTPPRGSATLIATALASDADTLARIEANHLAADLLGCKAATYGRSSDLADLIGKATDARAQVLTLALVLAGYEAATHTGSWRNVNSGTRRYLLFLADCGYTLADVERRACGEPALPYSPGDNPQAHDLDGSQDPADDADADASEPAA